MSIVVLLVHFSPSLSPSLSASLPVSVFLALALLALAMWRRPSGIVGIDHLALVTRHWPFGIGMLELDLWHCPSCIGHLAFAMTLCPFGIGYLALAFWH